ncbi:hypothetical protein LZ31DRAFT_559539 [Colletotrichum somersetense]|nr:hypothetical protein LZ31DRAFT_559539 [Colletotrichum somersetense]
MHFSTIFTLIAATVSFTVAAPYHDAKRDDTVCAPGTGFFQSCANGFRGCCKSDACTIGYCPPTSEKRQDPTVCAPGTGFFQSCSNGFRGCCKSDACTVGFCPDVTVFETVSEVAPKTAPAPISEVKSDSNVDPTVCAPGTGFFQSCSSGFRGCCKSDACTLGYCPSTSEKRQDSTVCAPGTGFFQSCANGFRGCCKSDACTIGYCPSAGAETVKRQDPTVCAPGTGFFQSCSNGFRGCCKSDACTLGYCPDAAAAAVAVTVVAEKRSTDPTVCAPGTGFFQSCSNGFRGCCKSDACTIGYCPDVKAFETVIKAAPAPTLTPEVKSNTRNVDPTVCVPGTGFFQSCSNGFRGCCKSDACTIGYCPSN